MNRFDDLPPTLAAYPEDFVSKLYDYLDMNDKSDLIIMLLAKMTHRERMDLDKEIDEYGA